VRMAVEVAVRIEILAVPVFVSAAAEVPRIVEQAVDAGDAADEVEEFPRLHEVIELRVHRAEFANALDGGFAAKLARLVARVAAFEWRKRVEQAVRDRCGEEFLDDDMAKRIAPRERARMRIGVGDD